MDLMGAGQLRQAAVASLGETITYTQCGTSLSLVALVTAERREDGEATGRYFARRRRWNIAADEMALTPQRGDRITDAEGRVWEVTGDPEEPISYELAGCLIVWTVEVPAC